MKFRILILFALFFGVLIAGCKKTSHEIIYGPVIKPDPVEQDTVLIAVKKVITTKQTDRDGEYYQDVFYLETKKDVKVKFVKAKPEPTLSGGKDDFFPNIVYEDAVGGPTVTIFRRTKNISYELHTSWNVPDRMNLYVLKYAYDVKDE